MIPLLIGAAAGVAGTFAVSKVLSKDKNFYTTKEVAELLKISEYTVRKKIRDGEIKAEPGKAYRIRKEDLEEYMRDNSDAAEVLSPEIIAQIMELKQMNLQRLKLQLQKLELEVDEYDPKEFQKRKLTLEIDINELESEIKAQQIIHNINANSTQRDAEN